MSSIFFERADAIGVVLRQSAKKQLDSYADPWIMMFELLQNALDAVEENAGPKRVRLIIDPGANEVTVSDNGCGFPRDMSIFGLGKGTKGDVSNHNIRGEHGIGMKMVVLCSDKYTVWTRTTSGRIWKAEFQDGWRFLERGEREEVNLDAKDSPIPPEFITTIRVRFPRNIDSLLRPIDTREILANIFSPYGRTATHRAFSKKEPLALFVEHYFRTSCYTGDVNRLFDGEAPSQLEINILEDNSLPKDRHSQYYPDFLIEHWKNPKTISFPASYWDPSSWYADPERKGMRLKNQLPVFNPSVETPNQLWVLKLTEPDEFRLLLQNPHIKDRYPPTYFDPLINNKIKGILIVVASAAKTAKYNINSVMVTQPEQVIAADGVITTNQIRTPKRGRNQSYLNNIHFLVNIADRVNYGKQAVKNPHLLSQLYQFFEEIYVKKLVDLATTVVGRRGGNGGPPPSPTLNILSLDDLDEPELSIKKVPEMENTLIALTHELIAKGRIEGLSVYQLSSIEQYDCKGLIRLRDTEPTLPERDDDLLNIEYKVKIMDLVNDIEEGIKDMKTMHLAIVWDDALAPGVSNYQYLDLEQSSYERLLVTGVDKVLRSVTTGDDLPVLCIRSLVNVRSSG